MVWKRLTIACLVCVLAAMLALPAAASAADISFFSFYDQGSFSLELYQGAQDIVANRGLFDDYLVLLSADYDVALVCIGDISYVNGSYSVISGFVYQFSTAMSDEPGYFYLVFDEVMDLEGCIVFSNLGPYPNLHSFSDRTLVTLLFALIVLTIMFLVREIFRFSLRMRVEYG